MSAIAEKISQIFVGIVSSAGLKTDLAEEVKSHMVRCIICAADGGSYVCRSSV